MAVVRTVRAVLGRLIGFAVVLAAGYSAFEIYVFNGDAIVAALLILTAIVAAGLTL